MQKIQNDVIINNNKNLIGKTLCCVCEQGVNDELVFRSEYNSPVIDTIVFVKNVDGKNVKVGNYYSIKITDVADIDLIGEIVDEIK